MSVNDRMIKAELARHEAVIERGIRTTIEAGLSMKIIYDEKLYEGAYKTFEQYVNSRWGYTRARAHQLIEAAEVDANLSTIVDKADRPQNEGQLREVAKAPPEKQVEVVKKVAEMAAVENRKPTAKDYKKVVGELVYEDVDNERSANTVKEAEPPESTHHPKEMAGPLMAHVKTLTQILNDLKKRATDRGGEWIDLQAISTQISALKYSLKSSIYYADCPACSGKRCVRCKQSGFLPELKKSVVEGD